MFERHGSSPNGELPLEPRAAANVSAVPVEPPPSPWVFPDPRDAEDDLVGIGADLAPGTLLSAYRSGIFPMPEHGSRPPMHWFSPVSRGIVPLDGLIVSRSLRRACRNFEIRVDTSFDAVVEACGDPARDAGWITREIATAYGELHRLGWAHSVEAWRDGELAGGLYGVGIGGLFAGESMFHRSRDASKVALRGTGRADDRRRGGRAAARRAVGDPPSRHPRRGRGLAIGVPPAVGAGSPAPLARMAG